MPTSKTITQQISARRRIKIEYNSSGMIVVEHAPKLVLTIADLTAYANNLLTAIKLAEKSELEESTGAGITVTAVGGSRFRIQIESGRVQLYPVDAQEFVSALIVAAEESGHDLFYKLPAGKKLRRLRKAAA